MKNNINILLTSAGRRSYLVKYFKEALNKNGEVHVSNSSPLSPAFSHADKSVVTPLIHDKNYIPFLLDYCNKNNIKAIIPLFDVDLPVLSQNKKKFKDIGVDVIVSNYDVVNICNDKYKTYKFFKKYKFNYIKTYLTVEEANEEINKGTLSFPLIIKPRWGMGSIGIYEADNLDELKIFYKKTIKIIKNSYLKYESSMDFSKSVIIQEKINGQEYGLDIINDLNSNYINTIVKNKIAMRAGETDISKVINNLELKKLGERISTCLNHIGNLDVDIIIKENKAYILEMNARFGGGYPFSHMSGVNLPKAIIKWLNFEQINDLLVEKKFDAVYSKDIDLIEIQNYEKE